MAVPKATTVRRQRLRLGFWLAAVFTVSLLAGCASQPPRTPPADTAFSVRADRYDVGSRAAAFAMEQLGAPYRYGGAGPGGFDCSGLVYYSYGKAGIPLPRTTGQLWDQTVPVPRRELRAGDLLFFAIAGKMQHVGLYVGDGRFVHAPSTGRTVTMASLSSDFYRDAFLRAGRPQL